MNHEPLVLKNHIRRLLQASLGLDAYLGLFALYRLAFSPVDPADRTFRAFLRLVPRDRIAVDVGANVGATTVALARRCLFVHAFEPVPGHARCVRRVSRWLRVQNVRLHEVALGSVEGDVSMVLPEQDGARLPGLARVARGTGEGARITVASTRLDTIASAFRGRVGAIKIDVEDLEADVLQGSVELLERDQPLVLAELWHTVNRDRAMGLLAALGYQALIVVKAGQLVKFEPESHPDCTDFVFLPRAYS